MERSTRKEYLEKVKVLREQLCIGVQEGMDLLVQTAGDLDKASAIFREKMLNITTEFVKLPAERVLPYLEKYRYDAGKAVDTILDKFRLIDGVPQPEPVYILHKYHSYKREALEKICRLICKKKRLRRDWHAVGHYDFPWFGEEDLRRLNEPSLCIVALTEWLNFEDAEGFEEALLYNLDLTVRQIKLLGLRDRAAALRMAGDIYREYQEAMEPIPDFYKVLNKDRDYQAARRFYLSSKEELINKLYDFIENNLELLELPA